jgi:hypothetical protein
MSQNFKNLLCIILLSTLSISQAFAEAEPDLPKMASKKALCGYAFRAATKLKLESYEGATRFTTKASLQKFL